MTMPPILFSSRPLRSDIFPTFRLRESFFNFRQDFYRSLAKSNFSYLPYDDWNWEFADLNTMQNWCLRHLLFQSLCDETKGKVLLNKLGPGDQTYLNFHSWAEDLTKLLDGTSKYRNLEEISYDGIAELFFQK